MRRLLSHWRRLLLAVFLLGLGYVLYQRLPPVERWSVRLDEDAGTTVFSFSADGRFLFSHRLELRGPSGGTDWSYGPFRKWDGASGQLLAEASTRERIYQSHSVDDFDTDVFVIRKRFWAGLPKDDKSILEVFELDSGKERRLRIKSFSGKRRLRLSPAEDMVAVFCYKNLGNDDLEADIFLHALPGGDELAVLSATGAALFSPDGSYFVYPSTSPDGPCIRLWDTGKRQSAGILPSARGIRKISSNGRFLVAEPVKENGQPILWDFSDLARPREVAVLPASARRLKFTPDSRTLVELPMRENPNVIFRESASGLEKGRIAAPFRPGHVTFSADSRLLAVREARYAGNFPIAVIDVPSRKVLWHKQLGDPVCLPGELLWAMIPAEVDTLFLGVFDDRRSHQRPQFRNARTGELLASFETPFQQLRSSQSESGQRILIHGHGKGRRMQKQGWFWETLRKWLPSNPDRASDLIRVIDVPSLREVFHLADSHVEEAQLSPDGGTLLTVHPKDPAGPHLRCWDIPGRHPWLKIVGIPAAVGLVLVLLGKWRQVRIERKMRLATLPAAQPPS